MNEQEQELKDKIAEIKTELRQLRNKEKYSEYYKMLRKETAALRQLAGTDAEKKQTLAQVLRNHAEKIEESIKG